MSDLRPAKEKEITPAVPEEKKADEKALATAAAPSRRERKTEGKSTTEGKPAKATEPITFACPYCNLRIESTHPKKDPKPFFVTCSKCGGEFGVRIVPVTVYQAEVAAFPKKGA